MFTNNQDEGKRGEDLAVEFLKKKGFKVIDRNFRIRGGEIDIVAINPSTSSGQKTLVFIEVKTRSSLNFGSPLEAINYWKLKALVKTAQFYKLKNPKLPDLMRIDAIAVKIDYALDTTEIEHVENIS